MITVAVVGDDLLAVAVARELACAGPQVVVHGAGPAAGAAEGIAYLRLLSSEPTELANDAAALAAWSALGDQVGLRLTSPADAVDVGPALTIATTLHESGAGHPPRALHPVEASRLWPQIRFDGLVAHQPEARRVHLDPARHSLIRSARARGVVYEAAATSVRAAPDGDVELLAGERWQRYDAAIVIADAAERSRLLGQPTVAESGCVLSVATIGQPSGWPSVRHQPGPPDADGLVLDGCRSELHDGRVELTLEHAMPDALGQLWEYAVRWLPGTIVSAQRVRTVTHGTPSLDTMQGRLAVSSPLAPRDRAYAPIVAAELARGLLDTLASEYETERAS